MAAEPTKIYKPRPPEDVRALLAGPDGLLYDLNALINRPGMENVHFEITLAVQGVVVTGALISGRAFVDGLAAQLEAAGAEASSAFVLHHLDDQYPVPDDGPYRYTAMVHLRDARYADPSGFMPSPPGPGLFWRGRIGEISGWSFGSFGQG